MSAAAGAAVGFADIDAMVTGRCDVLPLRGQITAIDAHLITRNLIELVAIACV